MGGRGDDADSVCVCVHVCVQEVEVGGGQRRSVAGDTDLLRRDY